MKILDGQQFGRAIGHPARSGRALAPGTVPVATGVVRDALVMAVIARFDMAAKGSGAAGSDVAQDALMLTAERAIQPMAVSSNHLCQFQRRTLEYRHQLTGSGAAGWAVGWG
jgi:hypothetical protein